MGREDLLGHLLCQVELLLEHEEFLSDLSCLVIEVDDAVADEIGFVLAYADVLTRPGI